MQQLRAKAKSLTFPPLSIARYSYLYSRVNRGVKLMEIMKKHNLRNGSKAGFDIRTWAHLIASPAFYHWATALHILHIPLFDIVEESYCKRTPTGMITVQFILIGYVPRIIQAIGPSNVYFSITSLVRWSCWDVYIWRDIFMNWVRALAERTYTGGTPSDSRTRQVKVRQVSSPCLFISYLFIIYLSHNESHVLKKGCVLVQQTQTLKSSFYIAQYPVRWTAQSAFHFFALPGRPVHSDTNSSSPGSILARQQLRAKTKSLTFPPLYIARYSFIQLSNYYANGESEINLSSGLKAARPIINLFKKISNLPDA